MSKTEILFQEKTAMSFGAGAWGCNFEKTGTIIKAYQGVPQRGYKLVSYVKATPEIEEIIKNLSGLDHALWLIEQSFIFDFPSK